MSKKSYAKDRAKYEAKRFFNWKSKRLKLAVVAPFAFMVAQPALDKDTVDDYKVDVEQVDQTMTKNLDNAVMDLMTADMKADKLANQVANIKKDGGEPTTDLQREYRAAQVNKWQQNERVKAYMLEDDRMTEQQFANYNDLLYALKIPVVQQNLNAYALNECKVNYGDSFFSKGMYDVEQCMTMENYSDSGQYIFAGIFGAFFSLLAATGLSKPVKQPQKPNRADYKPRRPRHRND